MTNKKELPFTGFQEYISSPLSTTDQRSLALIKRFFLEASKPPLHPFSILVGKLSGRKLENTEALICWQQILKHKMHLQQKLGRRVGIQTAAIDYFDYQSPVELNFGHATTNNKKNIVTIDKKTETKAFPDYKLEKMKEELLRSKRYKHALSIILIDIDNFHSVNDYLGFEKGNSLLETIVQIIKRIIRNVDFLSRLSGDRFLIILPNTNQREARELADRIRIQIYERTGRLKELSEGITATLSVGQCLESDSSISFIRRIEYILDEGKQKKRNTVYSII